MAEYRIELLPAATTDLENIFDYIMLENPSAAEQLLDTIISSLERLEFSPNSGVRISHQSLAHYHFRMIVIEHYIAFYKVVDKTVYIYRILHGARNYIQLLKPSE